MAVTKKLTQLEQLQERFAPSEHGMRTERGQTFVYLSIDAVINRLNKVLGTAWSTTQTTTLVPTELKRKNGINPGWQALCNLSLSATIDGTETVHAGVGAMANEDADMAAKTALAEAIKKAGHQLGIGLYLWDEDERALVEALIEAEEGSENSLRRAAFILAKRELGIAKPSLQEVADFYGVPASDLSEPDTLASLLQAKGLLGDA